MDVCIRVYSIGYPYRFGCRWTTSKSDRGHWKDLGPEDPHSPVFTHRQTFRCLKVWMPLQHRQDLNKKVKERFLQIYDGLLKRSLRREFWICVHGRREICTQNEINCQYPKRERFLKTEFVAEPRSCIHRRQNHKTQKVICQDFKRESFQNRNFAKMMGFRPHTEGYLYAKRTVLPSIYLSSSPKYKTQLIKTIFLL